MPVLEDVGETFEEGMNADVIGGEDASGAKTQEGAGDVICDKDVKDEASDNGKEEWGAMKMEGVHSEMKDSSNNMKEDPQKVEKGEEGDPDEMMDLGSAAIADESAKSLLILEDGKIPLPRPRNPGHTWKFATIKIDYDFIALYLLEVEDTFLID